MANETTDRRAPSRSARRKGHATLRVVHSAGETRRDSVIEVGARPLEIGRAVGEGHLELRSDRFLSRRHGTVRLGKGGDVLEVRDSSSTGTEVDGRRITEAEAQDGSVVRMGDTFLVFRSDDELGEDASMPGIDGVSPATRHLRARLALLAPASAAVLLLGETGTGKEIAARALHLASGRSGPFVPVNCAALPEALAESLLFGHVAGAYTGARGAHEGYFVSADGGTLLLDEVGELTPPVQAKLLRVLEERSVLRVGATRPVPLDVRIVAATNRDLRGAVADGVFRADLLARIADHVVELAPLRARREDVLPIFDRVEPGVTLRPDLVSFLLSYPWPFNTRELVKTAAALRLHARGAVTLGLDMLPDQLRTWTPEAAPAPPMERPSREVLEELLARHGGNVNDVARETSRSRRQVYRWLTALGIEPDRFRARSR